MDHINLKRTPLFETHQKLGAKLVPFAGWEMPVQYTGVIPEHTTVRTNAGLFDVSHMGEIFVTGPEAEAAIDAMTCNDVAKLYDGKAHYSAIINHQGGVVDDIIVYRFNREKYLICVNASNSDKDFAWFQKHNRHNAEFKNLSSEYGQIAVQGPKAVDIMQALTGSSELRALKYFHFCEMKLLGAPVIVARTGYTGEDGYEIFSPWKVTADIWQALTESGAAFGVVPVGLGARDSLRLEACYPLHGHELGDEITAIESGIGWVVKPDKGEFIGRDVLKKQKEAGAPRALVGLFVDDAGIIRQGDKLFAEDGKAIGEVTSGTKTPTINRALGLALVETAYSKVDQKIFAEVRGRKLACHVTKKPFYSKPA
jgi:aminomethyltransferase